MVNHVMNNETAKVTVTPYWADIVNHAMINKMGKNTDAMFVWHMICSVHHQQYKNRSKIIHLARKTPRYMIKKVYTW